MTQASPAVVKIPTNSPQPARGGSRYSFFAGLILIIAAAAIAFVVIPTGSGNIVEVTGRTGGFCGDLDSSTSGAIAIISSGGTVRTIPVTQITSVVPVSNC